MTTNLFGEIIHTDKKICRECNELLPMGNFEANRKFFDASSVHKYRLLRRPVCISCRSIKKPIDIVAKKSYPRPPPEFNCPICDNIVIAKNAKLDHCHHTGHIRGYLCNECNTGLGSFRDSDEVLQKAIDWLQQVKDTNNPLNFE